MSLREREITYSNSRETETGLSIETELFEAERGIKDVLFQARPRLTGFGAAGKECSGLESDGNYLK